MDQLDDEEIAKSTVMPRGMGQFTPPYSFGPTYVFSSPPHAHGVTVSHPSDMPMPMPSGAGVPNVGPGRDPSNLV